ncbi:4815_t:CDS:1, partial [Racocetra fulgida]
RQCAIRRIMLHHLSVMKKTAAYRQQSILGCVINKKFMIMNQPPKCCDPVAEHISYTRPSSKSSKSSKRF